MNEQTLWTSGTAIVVAFFTTVVAQYLFAPTLEARKQTLLERSKIASATADSIRALYLQLDRIRVKRFQLADVYDSERHRSTFHDLAHEFDASESLKHAGLKSKYVVVALSAQFAAEIFTLSNSPEPAYVAKVMQLLHHAINALDPVNLPWVRSFHCWRGMRVYGAMIVPPLEGEWND